MSLAFVATAAYLFEPSTGQSLRKILSVDKRIDLDSGLMLTGKYALHTLHLESPAHVTRGKRREEIERPILGWFAGDVDLQRDAGDGGG